MIGTASDSVPGRRSSSTVTSSFSGPASESLRLPETRPAWMRRPAAGRRRDSEPASASVSHWHWQHEAAAVRPAGRGGTPAWPSQSDSEAGDRRLRLIKAA
jgi:hypothetical protein